MNLPAPDHHGVWDPVHEYLADRGTRMETVSSRGCVYRIRHWLLLVPNADFTLAAIESYRAPAVSAG